jgi:hypothetical protein
MKRFLDQFHSTWWVFFLSEGSRHADFTSDCGFLPWVRFQQRDICRELILEGKLKKLLSK